MYIRYAYMYIRNKKDIIILNLSDDTNRYYENGIQIAGDSEMIEKGALVRDKYILTGIKDREISIYEGNDDNINALINRLTLRTIYTYQKENPRKNHLILLNEDYLSEREEETRKLDLIIILTTINVKNFVSNFYYEESDNKIAKKKREFNISDENSKKIKISKNFDIELYKLYLKFLYKMKENQSKSSKSSKMFEEYQKFIVKIDDDDDFKYKVYTLQRTVDIDTLKTYIIKPKDIILEPVVILYDKNIKDEYGDNKYVLIDGNHKTVIFKRIFPFYHIPSFILIPDFLN